MKPVSGGLIAFLNSATQLYMADLYTLTTRSGTFRWTSADTNLTLSGNTWTAATEQGTQPLIKRGTIRCVAGLETDVLDVDLYQGDYAQMLGVSLALAAANGTFDGARVRVERVIMAAWGDTSNGSLCLFEGVVAGVDISSAVVTLHVKSDLDALNRMMPRTLIMPGCANAFGDANCGKSLAALTVTGTATGSPTVYTVPSARAEAAGYFNLGVIQMTSGPAAGARRSITGFSGGLFTVGIPFPAAPQAGDTFSAYPGCDRTFGTCGTKWANQGAFRGAPFVPVPEAAR